MADTERDQLLERLRDTEDQFTERKLEGAGSAAFKKAIVSFANSVPTNRTGVLFVGVDDRGAVRGVAEPDKLQRTLRLLAENDCYPPIFPNLEVLTTKEGAVVATVVGYSPRRPHFAGPAYIRRGSESIAASDEVYKELLLSQDDRRRYLLDHKGASWTLEFINKGPGDGHAYDSPARSGSEARIEEVTAFFVRFRGTNGTGFTELLQDIHISYDDERHRPRLIIWPVGRP